MVSVSILSRRHAISGSLEDVRNAQERFRDCEAPDTLSIFPDVRRAFGFEVSWRSRDSAAPTQHRFCEYGLELQNESISTPTFSASLENLEPATTYIVTVRSFYVYFEPSAINTLYDMSYVFGPSSSELVVTTNDAVPQGAPLNVHVNSTSDTEIRVSYDPPASDVRHGEIQLYQAEIWEATSKSTSSGSDVRVLQLSSENKRTARSEDEQIGFDRLKPDTVHAVRVQAKTAADGWGNWSDVIYVSTCPSDMKRVFTNGDTTAECYARTGFYKTAVGSAESCGSLATSLFPGALNGTCEDEFYTVENLSISDPFWRADLSSADIRQCPNTLFCAGTESSNASAISPDQYCSEGHTGIYCWDCVEGYGLSSSGCVDCSSMTQEDKDSIVAAAVIITVVVQVVLLGYLLATAGVLQRLCCAGRWERRQARIARRRQSRPARSRRRFTLSIKRASSRSRDFLVRYWPLASTKLRIMLGYFQVLLSFQRTFQRYTANNNALFNAINVISNLRIVDAVESLALRCAYDYDYYDILLFMTLMPIAFVAVLAALCVVMSVTCFKRDEEMKKAINNAMGSVTLLLLFLVYPSTSETIFATFWCEEFPDANASLGYTTSALRSDYRVSCNSEDDPRRPFFVGYAAFMILVYPVGIVVVYGYVLWSIRKLVLKDRDSKTTHEERQRVKKGSFLTRPYLAKFYWYEAYELIRKLCQTSLVGFLQGLNLANVAMVVFLPLIELNLCIVFVVLLVYIRPYEHDLDYAFAVLSLLMLMPATQLSILDPYTRADWALLGLEVLVYLEIAFFVGFLFWESWALRKGWYEDEDEAEDGDGSMADRRPPPVSSFETPGKTASGAERVEVPSSTIRATELKSENVRLTSIVRDSQEEIKRLQAEVEKLKASIVETRKVSEDLPDTETETESEAETEAETEIQIV